MTYLRDNDLWVEKLPRTRKKRVLESSIEKSFVRRARKLGCICRKLNGMGHNHWPDQLVLVPGGKTLYIEFKKPGEGLRGAQAGLHEDVRAIGHKFYTFDNWEQAIALVEKYIRLFESKHTSQ